jgi:hypothetical protein
MKYIAAIVLVFVLAFGLSILLAFPVKWLWNTTAPELFGFKEIDVWMAWKLSFLIGLLFRGIPTVSSDSK